MPLTNNFRSCCPNTLGQPCGLIEPIVTTGQPAPGPAPQGAIVISAELQLTPFTVVTRRYTALLAPVFTRKASAPPLRRRSPVGTTPGPLTNCQLYVALLQLLVLPLLQPSQFT